MIIFHHTRIRIYVQIIVHLIQKHIHLHSAKRNDHRTLYREVDLNEKLQIASENQASVLIEVKTKESLIHSVAKLKKSIF